MSAAKWWVLDSRNNGFTLEERDSGDIVLADTESGDEHVLHGYVWKHSPHFGIQIQSEGPPPYGRWAENLDD